MTTSRDRKNTGKHIAKKKETTEYENERDQMTAGVGKVD